MRCIGIFERFFHQVRRPKDRKGAAHLICHHKELRLAYIRGKRKQSEQRRCDLNSMIRFPYSFGWKRTRPKMMLDEGRVRSLFSIGYQRVQRKAQRMINKQVLPQ